MSNTTELVGFEDRLIGLTYMLLSAVGATLYIPCLIVMRTDQHLKQHSCLRIMFHMGICDMLMLLSCFIGGLLTFTGYAFTAPYWLNRSLTTLTAGVGWFGYISFAHVLAIGRCMVYTNRGLDHRFFNPRATTRWLTICWASNALWMVCHFSPFGGYYYFGSLRCWYFDVGARPWVRSLVFYNCVVNLPAIAVWNSISIWGVHKMSSGTESTEAQRMERALFYQSVLICACLVSYDQFWHNGLGLLCPIVGIYCYPVGMILSVINASMNPIAYLTFNDTIKEKVRLMFGIGASNQVQVVPLQQGIP